jgi:KDO2-lipid IV(A) lauroyltransferase
MGTRREDGRLHVIIRPLADEIGRGSQAMTDILQGYLDELERVIKAAPEQYFWHHRRWKTRPPEELTEPRPV